MNQGFLDEILEEIRLLWEYEMAQRTVRDDAVPTPLHEREKIIRRIQEERSAVDEAEAGDCTKGAGDV